MLENKGIDRLVSFAIDPVLADGVLSCSCEDIKYRLRRNLRDCSGRSAPASDGNAVWRHRRHLPHG